MITLPLWIQSAIWFWYVVLCLKERAIMYAFTVDGAAFHKLNWQSQVFHILWIIFTGLCLPWNVHNWFQ